jgi:hypothetical protein
MIGKHFNLSRIKKLRQKPEFSVNFQNYALGQTFDCSALKLIASGVASASLQIALTGHSAIQAPQSIQVSGSITIWLSLKCIALTGQILAQVPHLIQESLITEGILFLLKNFYHSLGYNLINFIRKASHFLYF